MRHAGLGAPPDRSYRGEPQAQLHVLASGKLERFVETKREALFKESNLHLNRPLMTMESWDEDAIDRRGEALFAIARKLWPAPP